MSLTEKEAWAATFIATRYYAFGGVIGGLLFLRSVLLLLCSYLRISKMLEPPFPRFKGFKAFFKDESVVLKS